MSKPETSPNETVFFNVEKILAKKTVDDEIFYRIKWLGYGSQYNSWEPEKQLIEDGVKSILDAYNIKKMPRMIKSMMRLTIKIV
jgi:Chromo (CHRromatin Organisation MOdifier) domain/Chromo shadow domain